MKRAPMELGERSLAMVSEEPDFTPTRWFPRAGNPHEC